METSHLDSPSTVSPQETSGTLGEVMENVQDVAGAAADTATNVKDSIGEMAADVANQVSEAWDSTSHDVQEIATVATAATSRACGSTRQAFVDAFENANDMIRRYPVPALLVALGAGFLTALAFADFPRLVTAPESSSCGPILAPERIGPASLVDRGFARQRSPLVQACR